MEPIHEVCCGIDLHKDMLQACVLAGPLDQQPSVIQRKFGTQPDDLSELTAWLKALHCEFVAMESTGVYWHPIFFTLRKADIHCDVANPHLLKMLPGRKTDINDACWIADVLRHGLVRPSFVPEEDVQILRMYTRTYTKLVQERASNLNRIEKLLQINGIKLSSVLSDIDSLTGLRILHHLAENGSITLRDVERLRDRNCKKDAQTIHQALKAKLPPAVCRLLQFWLGLLEQETQKIDELGAMIEELFKPYEACINILDSIPGIDKTAAFRILGEIGVDMSFFPYGRTYRFLGRTVSRKQHLRRQAQV